MEKEIVNQVQEAQRVPYRINPRRNVPRHMILKAAREKQQVTYKGNLICLTADLYSRNSAGHKGMTGYI